MINYEIEIDSFQLKEMCLKQLRHAAKEHADEMLRILFEMHADLLVKQESSYQSLSVWEQTLLIGLDDLFQRMSHEMPN